MDTPHPLPVFTTSDLLATDNGIDVGMPQFSSIAYWGALRKISRDLGWIHVHNFYVIVHEYHKGIYKGCHYVQKWERVKGQEIIPVLAQPVIKLLTL